MRLNLSYGKHLLGNQSLLSQSLSDLRSSPYNESTQRKNLYKSSTPVRKRSSDCNLNNNSISLNCDHEDLLEESYNASSPRVASPDSMATMTPTSSQGSSEDNSAEMGKLYEAISEQKEVIIKCLESDQCDTASLNEQLAVLQSMQQK